MHYIEGRDLAYNCESSAVKHRSTINHVIVQSDRRSESLLCFHWRVETCFGQHAPLPFALVVIHLTIPSLKIMDIIRMLKGHYFNELRVFRAAELKSNIYS